MTIHVLTRDCSSLGDAEFAELADLSARSSEWPVGLLSKVSEEWVLVSQATDGGELRGFTFSTLERIGGTPALLIGAACVGRVRNRASVLRALMHDQYHRALMAFPDEDVIVTCRMKNASPFEALADLKDCHPWPDTSPGGEERAWGRRLAKRFGVADFNDRTMVATGGHHQLTFDHQSLRATPAAPLFEECSEGEFAIGWAWALAEFLAGFAQPLTQE